MELVAYIAAVGLVGVVTFWVLTVVYLAFAGRPLGMAVPLSWKMTLATVVGLPFLGFGGVALSIFVFYLAFRDLPDFRQGPVLVAGAAIAVLGAVVLYLAAFGLAWEILG